MKITKREVIFSIALICVMFIVGIVLSDKINDDLMEQYQKYNTALQINDDPELFRYGMRTNVGYIKSVLCLIGSGCNVQPLSKMTDSTFDIKCLVLH